MARLADPGVRLPAKLRLPDRYDVRRRIAHGGMASVWCAHDRVLSRDVAIKLLAEQFAHDPAAIRRFKREARAAAHLSGHPHVVTIYDVSEATGEQGRRAFIVMEYLSGGTVADAIRVGELSRLDAVQWLGEAADALDYAHGRGVVHRDIKPANFLLDAARVLHVADFGIARLSSEETVSSAGYMFGTAAYLAPERALGHLATEASDRYALAVVAFELLTGERPFSAEDFAALARLHIEEPVPRASARNPDLPQAVDAVLARGMAKQPEDRWPTATAFVDTLKLALTERAGRTGSQTRVMPILAAGTAIAPDAASARAAKGSGAPPPVEFLRVSAGHRPPRWALPVACLAAAALAIGAVIGAGSGSGSSHARVASSGGQTKRSTATRKHHTAHHAATAPAPTTAATTASTPSSTPSTPPASSASALQARGHALVLTGNPSAAIPVLQQAVSVADPSSLTYAYALFDLGHALRVSGNPRAAIPILYRRLQIPNQTGVVRAELQAALQAVGAQVRSTGGGAPGPPAEPGHGHGNGHINGNGKSD